MIWQIYLSGEIHTDWRKEIMEKAYEADLPVEFYSANTHHESSDAAGDHLGPESDGYWRDHKSAKVNLIRTKTMIENADLVIIRFGDKYKQWNAAFDAGFCAALSTPYITLHDESLVHALKEVDAQALAWTQSVDEVVETLKKVMSGLA